MKLTTKSYGLEISWTLGSCTSEGGYDDDNEYVEQCCLSPGSYNLKCKDSAGDGWQGGYIEVDGAIYCGSFTSGSEDTIEMKIQGSGNHS